MKPSLLLTALLLATPFLSHAQPAAPAPAEAPRGVLVRYIEIGEPTHDQLLRRLDDAFRRQLQLQGRPASDEGTRHLTLILDGVLHDETGRLALSITTMRSLPELVVELGAQAEAFYENASADELPTDGAFVRQYVTREWLRQYDRLVEQDLRIVEPDALEEVAAEVVAQLPSS
ncbi:MAG: hypothetical protein AAF970_15180 [Bacteroidota bacterium]